MKSTIVSALVLVLLGSGLSHASEPVDGVLSVTPVLEHACLAAEFVLAPGEQLAGLRWYNNDGLVNFPTVLLVSGSEGTAPDVTLASVVLESVTAGSSAWSEVHLDAPVTSASGVVHAVFEIPEGAERTGEGEGEGPGIGFVSGGESGRAYLSPDGATWVPIREDFALAVEPIVVLARGTDGGQPLESLREDVATGWWTDAKPNPVVTQEVEPSGSEDVTPSVVSAKRPLAGYPNPFNPRVNVSFYVATGGRVDVSVFDLRGRHVRRLVSESAPAGEHTVVWDGVDGSNQPV